MQEINYTDILFSPFDKAFLCRGIVKGIRKISGKKQIVTVWHYTFVAAPDIYKIDEISFFIYNQNEIEEVDNMAFAGHLTPVQIETGTYQFKLLRGQFFTFKNDSKVFNQDYEKQRESYKSSNLQHGFKQEDTKRNLSTLLSECQRVEKTGLFSFPERRVKSDKGYREHQSSIEFD